MGEAGGDVSIEDKGEDWAHGIDAGVADEEPVFVEGDGLKVA